MKHVKRLTALLFSSFHREWSHRAIALVLSAALLIGVFPLAGLIVAEAEGVEDLLQLNNSYLTWATVTPGTVIHTDRSANLWLQMPDGINGAKYVKSGLDTGHYYDVIVKSPCWMYVITPPRGAICSQAATLESKGYDHLDVAPFVVGDNLVDECVVYEKYCGAGETLVLTKWAVLIPSQTRITDWYGPLVPDSEMAILESVDGGAIGVPDPIGTVRYGEKVYRDRAFTYRYYPAFLAGKNTIQTTLTQTAHNQTARATRAGWVYVATVSLACSLNRGQDLIKQGFTKMDIPEFTYFINGSTKGDMMNLYKKYLQVGDVITYNRSAIPFFSGDLQTGEMAVLSAGEGCEVAQLRPYEHLFTDRVYGINTTELPEQLSGKSFIRGSIEGATATVTKAGKVYMLLPAYQAAYKPLITAATEAGFVRSKTPVFRLSTGLAELMMVYEKEAAVGETFHFGKCNILIFDTVADSEYVKLPSEDIPADLIYNPGPEFQTASREWQGIPSIERTSGGKLYAAWFSGDQKEPMGGNYAVVSVSTDDGVTWGEPILAINHPDANTQILDETLWIDPLGRLWLTWSQHTLTGLNGTSWLWASVCDDPDAENPVFSQPRMLSPGIKLNKITVLSNGEWIYPIWDTGKQIMPKHLVFSSTDNGATWTLKGHARVENTAIGENMIVEKQDGSLRLLTRRSDGEIAESYSYDGGVGWTDGVLTGIPNPYSRFQIRRLASGNLLLINNNHRTERRNMTAYLSTDDGATWRYRLLLDERNLTSYPDVTQAPDGTIYCIYDYDRYGAKEILMATFTEQDIIDGAFHSDVARQKVLVNKIQFAGAPDLSDEDLIRADLSQALTGSSSNYGCDSSAAAAVDGDLDTKWVVDGSNGIVLPQTLAFDLGKVKEIARIKTTFEFATDYEYELFTSLDGNTWYRYGTQADKVTEGASFINTKTVKARYVAIEVTKTGIDPNWNSPAWVAIREIEAQTASEITRKTVGMDDASILYLGRHETVGEGERLYFESGFTVGFTGTSVGVKIESGSGFLFSIDGGAFEEVPRGKGTYTLAEDLAEGSHTLRLYNSWQDSRTTVCGIVIDGGANLTASPSRPTIEFVGDSITAGTHNYGSGLKHSYSWMTGELLGFDFNIIAKAGIRLLADGGGDPIGMAQRYFKTYEYRANETAPDWDTAQYIPDYLVLNLTTNDRAAASAVVEGYKDYLARLREAYPDTAIFVVSPFDSPSVMRNGTGGYHDALRDMVTSLADAKVIFVDTFGWLTAGDFYDGLHPSDAGAQKAAAKLAAFIAGKIGTTTVSADLNVSLGKQVKDKLVASSGAAYTMASAASAFDGDYGTKWTPNGAAMPQQLTVDLGDTYSIGAVYFALEKYADWTVLAETSADGENWTEFGTGEGRIWEDTLKATASGRYVRLTLKNPNGAWTGVFEMAVYTTEAVSPMLNRLRGVTSAPRNLTAAPGVNKMTLSWQSPDYDGNSAVTGYQIKMDDGEWIDTAAASYTFYGLDSGTAYTFKVRAVNAYGESSEAAVTASTLPESVTGAPQLPGLVKNDLSDALLIASSSYGIGTSAAAAFDGNPDTLWLADGPGFPQMLMVDLGGIRDIAEVHAVFEQASTWEYAIYYSVDGVNWKLYAKNDESMPKQQSYTHAVGAAARYVAMEIIGAGLDGNGQPCWAAVRELEVVEKDTGKNLALKRPCAAASALSPEADVSSAFDNNSKTKWTPNGGDLPQSLTVDLGDRYDIGAVYIHFEEWSDWEFILEVSDDGMTWRTFAAPAAEGLRETVVEGDQNGRYVRLTVTGSDGDWSGVYTFDVYTKQPVRSLFSAIKNAPSAPRDLTAVPGDGQVTFTWSAPADDGNSTVMYYQVQVNGGEWIAVYGMSYTAADLTNGRLCTFAVRAVNAEGTSDAATVSATPVNPKPDTPEDPAPATGYRSVPIAILLILSAASACTVTVLGRRKQYPTGK
ncbi:MAG: discoidin domain-containing protein [Oscillospiraceae bacterium]|nr:discoidin domain-containing protein [Oscillospiraceae bacterium]